MYSIWKDRLKNRSFFSRLIDIIDSRIPKSILYNCVRVCSYCVRSIQILQSSIILDFICVTMYENISKHKNLLGSIKSTCNEVERRN